MNSEVRRILEAVRSGGLDVDDALLKLKEKPFEDIGRGRRRSFTARARPRSRSPAS